MKNIRFLHLLLGFIFNLLVLSASAQAEAKLAQANQFMVSKEYQKAAEVYEDLIAEGYSGAELLYNLGNAWYRAGDRGKAILNYERALRLQPYDQEIIDNLAIVREELTDEVIELEPFFLYRWWRFLLNILSATGWTIIGLIVLWAAFYFGYQYLYGRERVLRKAGFIKGLTLLAFGLLILFIAFQKHLLEEDSGAAIILAAEAPLCSAPNDPETALITLHAGTKVYLVDKIGEWQLVRLVNGDEGWINEQTIEKI